MLFDQVRVNAGLALSGNLCWNEHPPWQEQVALS